MVKAIKCRELRAALLRQGCVSKQGKGDHEKWYCPCGRHIVVVTQARVVSPGVVGDAINKLACLPKGMVAVKVYSVRAKRWAKGWELHIDGVGVTQSVTLARAEEAVRDYIATVLEVDAVDGVVEITPELGELGAEAKAARSAVEEAAQKQVEAAERSREVARNLRASGLSVTDTAVVLGISRGRVSQLTGP